MDSQIGEIWKIEIISFVRGGLESPSFPPSSPVDPQSPPDVFLQIFGFVDFGICFVRCQDLHEIGIDI